MARREDGQPAPRGRNEGFPAGSVLDASMPRNAGEGDRGRQFRKERVIDQSKDPQGRSRSSLRQQQQQSWRWFAVTWEAEWDEKTKKKRNTPAKGPRTLESQGRDPRTLEENSRGRDPRTSPPCDQGGRKLVRCHSQDERSNLRQEVVETIATGRDGEMKLQGRKKGGGDGRKRRKIKN